MASCFVGSPAFLSLPLTKPHQTFLQLSNNSQTTPPPTPQPESSPPPQRISGSTNEQKQQPPTPLVSISSSSVSNNEEEISNQQQQQRRKTRSRAESTDWVASTITRRFGLGAGLAWVGFLAVGVISEQIKTRVEVSKEQENTRDADKQEEIVLSNGIRYTDIRVGGGAIPRRGDLVVIDIKGSIKDDKISKVFVNTFSSDKKPLALVIGSRPYTRGMCEGIEYTLPTMKAGGKRRVIIPPNLGFGQEGADFGSSVQIPPNSTLDYIIEIEKVSIAPA